MVAQSRQILDIRENLNQLTSCLSDLICFSTSDRFGFFSGIEVEVFAEGAVGTWNRLEPLGWFISVFMSGVSLTLNFFCGGTTDLSIDNDVRNYNANIYILINKFYKYIILMYKYKVSQYKRQENIRDKNA